MTIIRSYHVPVAHLPFPLPFSGGPPPPSLPVLRNSRAFQAQNMPKREAMLRRFSLQNLPLAPPAGKRWKRSKRVESRASGQPARRWRISHGIPVPASPVEGLLTTITISPSPQTLQRFRWMFTKKGRRYKVRVALGSARPTPTCRPHFSPMPYPQGRGTEYVQACTTHCGLYRTSLVPEVQALQESWQGTVIAGMPWQDVITGFMRAQECLLAWDLKVVRPADGLAVARPDPSDVLGGTIEGTREARFHFLRGAYCHYSPDAAPQQGRVIAGTYESLQLQ
jgi:hypothetical protein